MTLGVRHPYLVVGLDLDPSVLKEKVGEFPPPRRGSVAGVRVALALPGTRPGEGLPALVADPGGTALGLVVELLEVQLRRLDFVLGPDLVRERARIDLEGGESLPGWIHRAPRPRAGLRPHPDAAAALIAAVRKAGLPDAFLAWLEPPPKR